MQTFRAPAGERLNGGLAAGKSVYTWGSALREWDVVTGESRVIARPQTAQFARAGCRFDGGFVLVDGSRLVWIARGRQRLIADDVETPDVLAVELFGRRGVLIIQKYAQVRFIELPSGDTRDIYSVYTPSRQSGLILHEVDGDGRPDFFCGNYWVRSPERFELPWRLFAINTWTEERDSGALRLALLESGRLVACQGEMPRARISVFEKPEDPRQLWRESPLATDLHYPRGLAVWDGDILVAEDAGPGSRLMRFGPLPGVLARTSGIHTLAPCAAGLAGIGAGSVTIWSREDMHRRPSASLPAPERTGP